MAAELQISDAEWQVMNVVWDCGPLSAADVAAALQGQACWSTSTIKTLLHRLVKKGALAYEQAGKGYLYRARVSRAACVRRESRSFVERVFGGQESALLEYFVRSSRLSAAEIEQLKQLLDERGPRRD
jgi:BlaI family penicillinase repressor